MFKTKYVLTALVVLMAFCLVIFTTKIHFDKDSQIGLKRTVHLKIAADKEFRLHCDWEKFIREVVKEASKQFDSQLGIKLKIEEIEEVETEIAAGKNFLRIGEATLFFTAVGDYFCNIVSMKLGIDWVAGNIDPEDCDMVVCFSGKTHGEVLGMVDQISGRYALITHSKEDSLQKTLHIFIHEIGHLFGAVHFFHTSSVMYPNATKSLKFDQVNKALILKAFKKQPKKH